MAVPDPNITTPPDPKNPPATGTPAGTKTGSGALPVSSYLDPGFSSSFLSGLTEFSKSMAQSEADLAKSLPSADDAIAEAAKLREAQATSIKASYGGAKEQLGAEMTVGERQLSKAGETLQLEPAAIKNRLLDFSASMQQFHTNYSKTLERLTTEENAALESNDATYLNNVRQMKLDTINEQRGLLQDQANLMINTFNTMMTGQSMNIQTKQYNEQTATNNLNRILASYGGMGVKFNELPQQDQQVLTDALTVLGMSPDSADQMLKTSTGNTAIIHDPNTGMVVTVDKRTGKPIGSFNIGARPKTAFTMMQDLSTNVGQTILNLQNNERAKNPNYDGKLNVNDYVGLLNYWTENAPGQLKTFFQSYSPKILLNPADAKSSDPNIRANYNNIMTQYNDVNKSATDPVALLTALMGLTGTTQPSTVTDSTQTTQ